MPPTASPRDVLTAHPAFAEGCCVTYVRGGDLTGIAQLLTEEATVDYTVAEVSGLALLDRASKCSAAWWKGPPRSANSAVAQGHRRGIYRATCRR